MYVWRRNIRLLVLIITLNVAVVLYIYHDAKERYACQTVRSPEENGDGKVRGSEIISVRTMATKTATTDDTAKREEDEKVYKMQLGAVFDKFPWFQRRQFTPNYYLNERNNSGGSHRLNVHDATYVFVHNQKSGGTTLKNCIDRVTTKKKMPKYVGVWDEHVVASVIREVKAKRPRSKFYVSENTFGLCDEFNTQNCSYFTLIRDPYERLISCHEFCKRALGDPLCAASDARKLTLKEWALHQGSYFFRQLQFHPTHVCSDKMFREEIAPKIRKSKYLGRNALHPPCWYQHKIYLDDALSETDKNALLKYTVDNLENWFTVIGITEEYRTTLSLLQQAYDLPFRDLCSNLISMKGMYKVDGKPASAQSREKLIQDLKAELQADPEVNRTLYYDVKIYEKAREIFEEQKKQYFSITGLKNK